MSEKYSSLKTLLAAIAVGGMIMFSPKVGATNGENNVYISYGNEGVKAEYIIEKGYKDSVYFREKNLSYDTKKSEYKNNIEFYVKDNNRDGSLDEIYVKAKIEGKNKNTIVIYKLKQKDGVWKVVDVIFSGNYPGDDIWEDEYFHYIMTTDFKAEVEEEVNGRIKDFTQILDNFSGEEYTPPNYDPLHPKKRNEGALEEIWNNIITNNMIIK